MIVRMSPFIPNPFIVLMSLMIISMLHFARIMTGDIGLEHAVMWLDG